jgi:hypothetical protein
VQNLDNGSYLVRQDYLDNIPLANRDLRIAGWLEQYLEMPYSVRCDECRKQGTRISWVDNMGQSSQEQGVYTMTPTEISIGDGLIERLRKADHFNAQHLDESVNAAIRLGLSAEGVEGLKP